MNDVFKKIEQLEKLLRVKESQLRKTQDALEDLHSICCSLLIDATDCVSHFEVSGNSMNALEDQVKSKSVQDALTIKMMELRPTRKEAK